MLVGHQKAKHGHTLLEKKVLNHGDPSEAHWQGSFKYSKPGKKDCITELAADEFKELWAIKKDWYFNPPEIPYGKKVWEPYNDKRPINEYKDGVYGT